MVMDHLVPPSLSTSPKEIVVPIGHRQRPGVDPRRLKQGHGVNDVLPTPDFKLTGHPTPSHSNQTFEYSVFIWVISS